MKIPPWLSLAFKIHTAVIGIILAAAQASPEHFGGTIIAGDFTFWGGLELAVTNAVFALLGTGAQPSITLAGKVS